MKRACAFAGRSFADPGRMRRNIRRSRREKANNSRARWDRIRDRTSLSADKETVETPAPGSHAEMTRKPDAIGGDSASRSAVAYRCLAREPILDRLGSVHAYELLFRDGVEPAFSGNGDLATETMIDNFVLFGLQNLTNGSPAFVNCTADTLMGQDIRILPSALTVLEILEDVQPSPAVLAACRDLKAAGYRLALDDFLYQPGLEPLIQLADFIKIDFLNSTDAQRRNTLAHLKAFGGKLIAEKIETEACYEKARREGFSLFQGYYFCQPLLLKKQRVPANQLVHVKLLQMLHEEPLKLMEIDEVVKSEPALTYRLLRFVNSPVYGLRDRITSIRAALIVVGDDLFRRIATLAIASELNQGPSSEILRLALVRARFCESMAILYELHPTEQYLLGLFSLLPAMLQKPMELAVAGLPLRDPLRGALLGQPNALRRPLDWLEVHERGDFDRSGAIAQAHGLEARVLSERFTEAVVWADQLLAE